MKINDIDIILRRKNIQKIYWNISKNAIFTNGIFFFMIYSKI